MILHTVSKSPFHSDAFASCLRNAADADHILLIEDGVYALLGEQPERRLFTLADDVAARGLSDSVSPQVTPVDYDGFVRLAAEASGTQSWY